MHGYQQSHILETAELGFIVVSHVYVRQRKRTPSHTNSGMRIHEVAFVDDMLTGKSAGTNIPPCILPYRLPVLCSMARMCLFALASSNLCGV